MNSQLKRPNPQVLKLHQDYNISSPIIELLSSGYSFQTIFVYLFHTTFENSFQTTFGYLFTSLTVVLQKHKTRIANLNQQKNVLAQKKPRRNSSRHKCSRPSESNYRL